MKKDFCSYFVNMGSISERLFKAGVLAGFALSLTACAGSGVSEPSPSETAQVCQLLDQDPQWRNSLQQAEQRWQLAPATALAVLEANADAEAEYVLEPYGLSWDEYRVATEHWKAKPAELEDAVDFIGWNLQRSQQRFDLAAAQVEELYLAYRLGSAYPRRLLRQPEIKVKAEQIEVTAARYAAELKNCESVLVQNERRPLWLKWMN